MKAAVLPDFGQPLSLEDVPVPEPREGEVLVQVEACGVCHSDLHLIDGDTPGFRAALLRRRYHLSRAAQRPRRTPRSAGRGRRARCAAPGRW